MSNVYLSTTVNEDGTITIPAFAVRGMGYEPADEVNLTIPAHQYMCECEANELFISRCCGEADCLGYTSDGEDLNVPARLLADANLPICGDISLLVADGALVVVATQNELDELPAEFRCLLNDLGINPSPVRVVRGGHGDA